MRQQIYTTWLNSPPRQTVTYVPSYGYSVRAMEIAFAPNLKALPYGFGVEGQRCGFLKAIKLFCGRFFGGVKVCTHET